MPCKISSDSQWPAAIVRPLPVKAKGPVDASAKEQRGIVTKLNYGPQKHRRPTIKRNRHGKQPLNPIISAPLAPLTSGHLKQELAEIKLGDSGLAVALYTMPPEDENSEVLDNEMGVTTYSNVTSDVDQQAVMETEARQILQKRQEEYGNDKGTKKCYPRHVKNYEDWMLVDQAMREHSGVGYDGKPWKFVPAQPITATKVIHFLDYEFSRTKKTASGKSIPNSNVGASSIRQTINALERHRFRHQHSAEYEAVPESKIPLRQDFAIHELERLARAREPKRLKSSQELKANGIASKTYTEDDLIRMSQDLFYSPNGNTKANIHYSLRDRTMLLFGSSMALRGDDTREILLSDIRLRDVPIVDIGLDHKVKALVVDSLESKTNTEGKFEEFAAFRHRNVNLCPIGGASIFLFSRWHILQKPLPNFAPVYDDSEDEDDDQGSSGGPEDADSEDDEEIKARRTDIGYRAWYDVVLFPSSVSETKKMSAENHRERFNAQKKRMELNHKQVTHVGRTFGATTAIERGASIDSVRILGRWSQSAGSFDVYNCALPTDAMAAAAGFNGKRLDSYFISRDALDPPAELMSAIFPWIEREEDALVERISIYGVRANDQTLIQLLQMLRYFRRVLLQDAAVQFAEHPSAPIFRYAPFNTETFRNFSATSADIIGRVEDDIRRNLANAPERLTIGIQGALTTSLLKTEELCRKVDQTHAAISHSFGGIKSTVRAALVVVSKSATAKKRKQIDLLIESLEELIPENLADLEMHLEMERPLKATKLHASAQAVLPMPAVQAAPNPSISLQLPSSTTSSVQVANQNHAVVSGHGNVYSQTMFPIGTMPASNPELQALQLKALAKLEEHFDQDQLRKHRFEWIDNEWLPDFDSFWAPHVGTSPSLEDIWKEHTVGMNGRFSIKQLREHWGTRWRRKKGGIKTEEGRRKKVISLIERLISQPGWTDTTAFKFMNEKYPFSSKSTSIHLKSSRSFIQHYLQRTDICAVDEILTVVASYQI